MDIYQFLTLTCPPEYGAPISPTFLPLERADVEKPLLRFRTSFPNIFGQASSTELLKVF